MPDSSRQAVLGEFKNRIDEAMLGNATVLIDEEVQLDQAAALFPAVLIMPGEDEPQEQNQLIPYRVFTVEITIINRASEEELANGKAWYRIEGYLETVLVAIDALSENGAPSLDGVAKISTLGKVQSHPREGGSRVSVRVIHYVVQYVR